MSKNTSSPMPRGKKENITNAFSEPPSSKEFNIRIVANKKILKVPTKQYSRTAPFLILSESLNIINSGLTITKEPIIKIR